MGEQCTRADKYNWAVLTLCHWAGLRRFLLAGRVVVEEEEEEFQQPSQRGSCFFSFFFLKCQCCSLCHRVVYLLVCLVLFVPS